MVAIKREIFVTRKAFDTCIDITYGTDMFPIELRIADYVLPGSAIAVAYAIGHDDSGELKKTVCEISDNIIIINPQPSFFVKGKNTLQVRITASGKELYTYKGVVICHGHIASDDAEEVVDNPTLMEQILSKVGDISEEVQKKQPVGDYVTTDILVQEKSLMTEYFDKAIAAEEAARISADNAEREERKNSVAVEKAERISAINTEASERKMEIAVERARIDAFTALPEGSTTGDAALEDIKVKVNGTVADTAGNAVREQVTDLDNKIDAVAMQLSEEIGELIQLARGSYGEANTQNINYNFVVGHTYEVRNTSEISEIDAKTYNRNKEMVEHIGYIKAGKTVTYSPSVNAPILHFYMNGAGSFECEDVTLRVPSVETKVKTLEGNMSVIEKHIKNELSEIIITPELRNGSIQNLVNKNGISTLNTISTKGVSKVIIKTNIVPQEGYYFYWVGAKYSVTGTESNDNTGRRMLDPWIVEEVTDFEIDVSDCLAFAITLFEKSKEDSNVYYPHRVETDGNAFSVVYCYGLNEIESRLDKIESELGISEEVLNIDYNSLKNLMNGKVNFAVQTDTHLSCFTNYRNDGNTFIANDFVNFEKVLRSIKKLDCDSTVHLGDIVRGYEFDTDFETRKSIDNIVKSYSEKFANMFYVIGNHDDGNMFYKRTEYNDNPSVTNVLFPFEQFNRITKFGVSGKNNKNYYYTDINGIRMITLYQKDCVYNNTAIPRNEEFIISEEQIEWLRTDALNTTNPVIILTHAPLVSDLYETGGTGFSDVLLELQNFKSSGGTVIAVLSGHTHKQDNAVIDGINHIVFKNGSLFFELVSVDMSTKTISCKPVNNAELQQRSFSY